ncbi:decaprenyl-phosphate phosphoribosyltransferase [Hoylesella loescheii]|uniref:Prenyltransferase, UbiA family n=1 Tax=Hoylesella loescheii DSM 19665 = JCM 12249 = ATCC 15930 TaxID=1122985 RepID=A0A069QEI9_HOYLO|nr:decaprenyl-phosphate phosphoribosyltransferase [Hoylesella loescheii]KDR51303.1 prenyltransferase, UbiA family [Hoylesella loescheii DSM 19665 = JCM 12249 = ATCC 15930]
MKKTLLLIRPQQWIKNGFVLIPMFFGGRLLNVDDAIASVVTFFAFSFVASAIYCFNDIVDVEADRRHPIKCHRPIASGAVSVPTAYALMVILTLLSALLLFFLPQRAGETAGIVAFYFLLNMAYCLWLKRHAIIDVCTVAFGFVLRILAGGMACDVAVSNWLVLMTFLLALFLSFAKRRDDVLRMNETGEPPRRNTIRYNLTFVNQAITVTGTVTLVCYIMYTVSPEVVSRFHAPYLYLTSIFVLVGLLRYMQLTVVDEVSGDPTKILLRDRFTQAIVVAWIMSFLLIIY